MGIKYYTIEIKGNQSQWSIPIGKLPKQTIEDWRADGLEISEIHNSIPYWWPFSAQLWCRIEDIFNSQNPFK